VGGGGGGGGGGRAQVLLRETNAETWASVPGKGATLHKALGLGSSLGLHLASEWVHGWYSEYGACAGRVEVGNDFDNQMLLGACAG